MTARTYRQHALADSRDCVQSLDFAQHNSIHVPLIKVNGLNHLPVRIRDETARTVRVGIGEDDSGVVAMRGRRHVDVFTATGVGEPGRRAHCSANADESKRLLRPLGFSGQTRGPASVLNVHADHGHQTGSPKVDRVFDIGDICTRCVSGSSAAVRLLLPANPAIVRRVNRVCRAEWQREGRGWSLQ